MDEAPSTREFALQRWGTRFSVPATEDAFHQWRLERQYAATRLAIVLGTALVIAWHAAMVGFRIPHLVPLSVAMIAIYAAIAGQFVGHARRDAHALRFATTGALWLQCLVALGFSYDIREIDEGAAVVLGATVVSFWLAVTVADRQVVGVCATYACAALAFRVHAWAAGELTLAAVVLEGLLLAFALLAVPLIVASAERSARTAYRQERIIESQRQTIAQQQTLLEKELSHQVAERSRELGAVLARSEVTLDVRRLVPGERFAERYKILALLGAGGMGAVYEVERASDAEKLALKVVVGEVSGGSAARFAREAEIGARIRHSNLISIVDVGVSSGVPFLVMELVRGGSLEAQRARFGDVTWALPILRQIAEGLAALHDAGVVHRDLKPANVLLADGSVAKISDFGISRFGALDAGASIDPSGDTMAALPKPRSTELTGTGVVMGTPLYMAPEGAKSARALDASADVFAFGILAYEMLTGQSPFPVPAFMLAMAEQPIPTPPAIDDARVTAALAAVLHECFAGDPAKRPRVRAILTAAG